MNEDERPFNLKECADFWEYYSCITEYAQEKVEDKAQEWLKRMREAAE